MASFCSGCGFPQGTNVGFCPNCGARQQGGSGQAAPAAASAPVPAKAGSGLKIVLVLVGCVALAGAAAIGGMIYLGHRVKQAVVRQAKSYGVELPSTSANAAAPAHLPRTPCELLSKEEASKLIGEPVERAETHQGEGCWYFGPAGLSTKLANDQANGVAKSIQSAKGDADAISAIQAMANSIGAGEQKQQNGAEVPLLMVITDPDGEAQMTALTLTKGIFGGIGQRSGAPGFNVISDVPGLGDKAVRASKMGLNVLKGGVLVRVIAGPLPDADAKTIAVAKAVLEKI